MLSELEKKHFLNHPDDEVESFTILICLHFPDFRFLLIRKWLIDGCA